MPAVSSVSQTTVPLRSTVPQGSSTIGERTKNPLCATIRKFSFEGIQYFAFRAPAGKSRGVVGIG